MSKKKVNVSEHYRKVNIDYNDKNNRFKREYAKIILFAFFLLSIVGGVSYALFTNTLYGKKTVEVTSGTFKIDFKDGNIINLNNVSPVSDTAGLQTTPYTFIVSNTGSLDAKYNISLEEKDNGVDALDRKYIKYSLKEGDGEWSSPALLSNGLTLTANKLLSSGKEETFQLKIWLDETAPNEVQGKKYDAKIVVDAVQTNSNLANIAIPIININGNSEINIEEGNAFNDPGVGEVKDSDGSKIDISKVSTRYEYFDGENSTIVDKIDTSKIGIYYIYYELIDENGNSLTTAVRTVNVYHKDNVPPTISLIGDEVVNLKYGEKYQEYGAMASDNENGNLTDKIIIFGEVNNKKDGIYLIKYFVRDNTGNLASVTRTVIVGKKTGKVESNIEEIIDDKDSTEAGIKIDTKVDSDTDIDKVTYAITTTKEKPANKDFKTLEELEKMEKYKDGKFVILENGTYYIWTRDEKGNITCKKFTISNIDETKPECIMEAPKYVGVDVEQDITISCTDIVGIKKTYLSDKAFNIDNKNVTISNISAPEDIDGGYQYVVTVKGEKVGESKITLNKDSVYDNARNGNLEVSSSIKVSQIILEENKTTLDVSTNPTYKIKTTGTNQGKLMYTGYDKNIVSVSSDGVITALNPGSTNVAVVEKNGYASATFKVNVNKTLTATFHKSGRGVKSISKEKLTCVLTKDSPEECSIDAPSIEVLNGYTALGWNTDKNAHEGYMKVTLRDHTDFYTISRKELITYSAVFYANGATLSDGKQTTDDTIVKSCVLPEVYNDENQNTSCDITTPTIIGNSNTPIVLGYSKGKSDTSKPELKTNTTLTLNKDLNNTNYFAITTNNPITYQITYEKNGFGVISIEKEDDSCTIPSTYNGIKQNTSCTVIAPAIDVSTGYTAIGWNFDGNSHNSIVKDGKITITKDSVLYAISRKDSITYTANFHKNGVGVSKISSTNDSCTIPEVFNNEVQDTKCKIGLPTITVTGLYYELGWSQDREATTKAINSDDTALNGYMEIADGIYLDHNTDLYSISKKDQLDLSAEFYENGTILIGDKNVSCTLKEVYNNEVRADNCILDIPTIQRDNFDIIGYNTDSNGKTNDDSINMKSHQINIDKNNNGNKYYAISKRKIDITYDKNGVTSLTKDSDTCTIWNAATSCEITTPKITRDGFEIHGYSTDKDATSENNNLVPHNSKYLVDENHKYYAITSKYIEDKFYINGALGLTDVSGKIVNTDVNRSCTIYNRETKCSITTPAIAASYNTPDIVGFATKSNATVKDLDPNQTIDVTDKVDYYAITKKDAITYSASYHKDGIGVTAIEKTTDSCTIPTVYNGMRQDDYCTVTLPNISVENNQYEALGWSQNADAQQEVLSNDYSAVNGYMGIGQKIRLDKNISLTSIVRKKTITLKGYFYRNGAKSLTYTSNGRIVDSTDDVVTVTCDLEATYNNHKQATSCSITSPIINASENTPEVIGFANNSTDILKSLDPNKIFDITSDVTYYAITKKSSITLNANFNANNSTISDTAEKRCTLKETYNGNKQDTTCSVTPPKVTASSNTPDFLGWNLNSNDHKNYTNYNLDNNVLTLSEDISGNTWYAITEKKEVYYNVNYKIGDHVKNISKDSGRCKIDATYNGEVQTKTCIIGEKDTENNPVITADVGYTSLGWSQLKGTTVGSPVVVLTKDNMTFYANASANHYNIEFYTDDHIYHTISATYDEAFTLPTIKSISLTKRGYTFKKWISEGVDYADGVKVSKNLASEEGAKVRFDAVWSDEEKPVCRFTTIGSTTTLNTTIARLECTDTGSGIIKTTLQPSDFSVSDAKVGKVVSVASPVEMTDGYYWDLTVQGLSVGSFDITFGANKVSDSNQHYPHEITTKNFNDRVTSTSKVNVAGRVYSVNYTKGNYVSGISSTTGSCTTTGSNIACNVVLPGITANRGYTVSGWSNGSTITPVGENYELNENNTSYSGQPITKQTLTLTAIAKDITPPTCSISESTSNWTQSAVLSVSASDDGSGLANEAYSWTSKTAGFTSDSTTTVNKNTTYTAYVKDKDGNVGSCSKAVSNIDITKPVCIFDNPSDTTIVSGNTATVKLSCTDTQSGITAVSRNLSTNSFSITNSSGSSVSYAKVTAVSAPVAITSGYSYNVTVQGVSYGSFILNLLDGKIIDTAGNVNNKVTSNSMTAYYKAIAGSCNQNLVYNGSAQTLASGGTGISFTNNSRTNQGSQKVTMSPNTGYMFSDEVPSKQTDNCTIAKKDVTFTAQDKQFTYDGNAHTYQVASITAGSLVNGHKEVLTFDGNSSIKDVSSSPVSNTITNVVINDTNGTNVTNNYNISTKKGSLTMIKANAVNPTLTAYNAPYDGKPHTIGVTGGSGGTIKYSTDKSNWSTANPTVTDATNSGAVTVYVKVFGDSNHSDSSIISSTITISKKTLSVSWSSTSSFMYNGSPHSRVLSSSTLTGVNSETVNLSTSGSGTNVGSYTTTASISSVTGGSAKKDNYSLTNDTASFSIDKATPILSVSLGNGTVGSSVTYSYSYDGDGTVTCSSGSTTIATCSVDTSKKTVTINYKSTGSTTITLSATEGTNYNSASSSSTITAYGVTRTVTVYANGNSLSTPGECSVSGSNRVCSCTSSGSSTSCNVTLPTISNSTTPNVCGYTTSSTGTTSCSIANGARVTLSSSTNYYAQTYSSSKTYTAAFTGTTEPGVSSIGATSKSCSIASTYNGTAQESSCSITSPTITVTTGNTVAGWYNILGSYAFGPGETITLSSNPTFTAKANITAAGVTYTDTYSMGCSTLQCAIDKIHSILY